MLSCMFQPGLSGIKTYLNACDGVGAQMTIGPDQWQPDLSYNSQFV